jgi:DNA repair protein RadC
MQNYQPLISVAITAYKSIYLSDAIDSVLCQTVKDYELIIVNDASPYPIGEVVNKYNGIGPAKAISLAAAFELGCRCRDEEVADDPQIRQSSDVYNIMRNRLERLNYEEFWVLMLSRSNRVIYEERLSQGGTASTVVDIKLLFKSVIDKLASGIILVHNHPSGNCTPSQEDDRLTHRIKDAGTLLDIKVFDHIIITPNNYYSYADNSRL